MQPVGSFDEAAALVVDYLASQFPLGNWSVNRRANERSTVLVGSGTPVAGASARWEDTACSVMSAGRGPRSVPDLLEHPAYRNLRTVREMGLRAYTARPIADADGSQFGTICGFDRRVMPIGLLMEIERLVEAFATLLEAMLRVDRERLLAQRREEAAADAAGTDALTGLRNRRGWDAAVALESARLSRFGDPAVVVVVDLDGLKAINDRSGHQAGDAHLRRAAAVLSGAVRGDDVLARLGGDEFAWLLLGASADDVGRRVGALWDALLAGGIDASLGWASVGADGLERAVAVADERMYIAKRRRRSGRPGTVTPAPLEPT